MLTLDAKEEEVLIVVHIKFRSTFGKKQDLQGIHLFPALVIWYALN
jgi:hypothetical protein